MTTIPSRIAISMVFLGLAVYVLINVILGFIAALLASSTTNQNANWVFGIAALVLAFVTFAAGGGLLAVANRNAKGLGLGLLAGWVVLSILTAGIATGLNPGIYTH